MRGDPFAMLDQFADRVPANDAEQRFPDVAAHLRVCSPCAEDLDGLLGPATDPAWRDARGERPGCSVGSA
jgi:hypothetical protein